MKIRISTSLLCGMFILVGRGAILKAAESQAVSTSGVSVALASNAQTAAEATVRREGGKPTTDRHGPTFLKDVLPIFMGRCMRCHNPQAKLLYDWSDYKTAFGDRWEIERRVWDSWKGRYYKQVMPVGAGPPSQMTEQERLIIKEWVRTGAAYGTPPSASELKSKANRIETGKGLFAVICTPCHQPTGSGIPGRFPPLAGSDFLNEDKGRAIRVLLKGLSGEVTVNGQKLNSSMPQFPLSDDDIANVLTFVYNSFGNSQKDVTSEEVSAIRRQLATEMQPHGAIVPPVTPRPPPSPFE
jgi:mono/diheme cytochrome c family protein